MMEPQEMDYCCCYEKKEKDGKRNCGCLAIIIGILFSLLLATIGLILGAVFATTLVANLAVLIASAAILALLFILTIIYKICVCRRNC